MLISETHSSSDVLYDYICKNDNLKIVKKKNVIFAITRRIKEIFLPQGYPDSVSHDYMQYQIWDTIQALASTVTSTVANQAILKGIGVGDDKATLLGATITWIMKDGAGLIGRILFAYCKGTFLDCNCKRWRLFADVLVDVSIFLDICTGWLPQQLFIFIICLSSIGRSIVGVAGGATRAALTMHQARRNNMADVSAKDSSQESMSNLIGLVMNLMVVSLITDSPRLIWGMVLGLITLHLYANYRAVRAVCMSSFNQSRLHCAVRFWLKTGGIIDVKNCNLIEPVWSGLKRYVIQDLWLGCSVTKLSKNMKKQLRHAVSIFRGEKYVLLLDKTSKDSAKICILLKEESSNFDQIKAVFQAEIIDYLLSKRTDCNLFLKTDNQVDNNEGDIRDPIIETMSRSLDCCNNHFGDFINTSQIEGWVFNPILLGADEWRLVRSAEW